MSLSIGIVGLPNTGKSTLFQAITQKQVDRANYPFCTIEPNLGVVAVPDQRLDALIKAFPQKKRIATTIEFLDIAGLITGASQGEGLGNRFLSHIRETSAIIYVLRGFKKQSIVNTCSEINPWAEKEILDAELALKDLETIEKRIEALEKEVRSHNSDALKEVNILDYFAQQLKSGKILGEMNLTDGQHEIAQKYQFLTSKPRLYLINASDEEIDKSISDKFKSCFWMNIDILIELETGDLNEQERKELGLSQVKINSLIQHAYQLLDLITFFTMNENEIRAWPLKRGKKAPEAGGVVHTDFECNFIRAEVINWQDLIAAGGIAEARQKGLLRTEGHDYEVEDGDVVEIKASV